MSANVKTENVEADEVIGSAVIGDLYIELTKDENGNDQLTVGKGAKAVDSRSFVALEIDWANPRLKGVILGD